MGVGGGITFNPLLLAAMGDVAPSEAGLASGIVNTAFMMGSARLLSLTGGYHAAFLAGALFAAAAAALGALLLRPVAPPAHEMGEAPVAVEETPA